MLRHQFIAMLLAAVQNEDVSHETLLEVLGKFVAALSEGNADAAIDLTDNAQPAMRLLAGQLRDLLRASEVGSAIDPEDWTNSRTVVLDWILEIRSADNVAAVTRKREKVTCKFEKKGRSWKIAALEPAGFFKQV